MGTKMEYVRTNDNYSINFNDNSVITLKMF